eukprot:scaffold11890_cov112-Isochrysis_galbana.AAC.3
MIETALYTPPPDSRSRVGQARDGRPQHQHKAAALRELLQVGDHVERRVAARDVANARPQLDGRSRVETPPIHLTDRAGEAERRGRTRGGGRSVIRHQVDAGCAVGRAEAGEQRARVAFPDVHADGSRPVCPARSGAARVHRLPRARRQRAEDVRGRLGVDENRTVLVPAWRAQLLRAAGYKAPRARAAALHLGALRAAEGGRGPLGRRRGANHELAREVVGFDEVDDQVLYRGAKADERKLAHVVQARCIDWRAARRPAGAARTWRMVELAQRRTELGGAGERANGWRPCECLHRREMLKRPAGHGLLVVAVTQRTEPRYAHVRASFRQSGDGLGCACFAAEWQDGLS